MGGHPEDGVTAFSLGFKNFPGYKKANLLYFMLSTSLKSGPDAIRLWSSRIFSWLLKVAISVTFF